MIRAGSSQAVMENAQKLEDYMPEMEKDVHFKSVSVILSLSIIIILNLIEIGYFIYSVYIFNDLIVSLGSAVLVGYTLYSMIKFLPKVKNFFKKPFEYLIEKTQGFESILNFVMVSLEIVFCAYILVKVIIKFKFFG